MLRTLLLLSVPLGLLLVGLLRLRARFRELTAFRQAAEARERADSPILDRSPLGIVHVQDRRFRWVNPRWAEIFGLLPEHLEGASADSYHQDQAAFVAFGEAAYPVLARGERYAADIRLRHVDGSPFWGHLVGNLLVPGQPEAGAVWCLEDVTERVEAQEEVSEVLTLNQMLIASSPTGILLYRALDGACVLANPAAAKILGGSQSELLNQNYRRIPSWETSGLRAAADLAQATGVKQRVELHHRSSFGRDSWLDCHLVPFTSRGEPLILVMADDVTGRVEASTALWESQERYRVVVEALTEGLAIVGADQVYTYCNQRLAGMLGYEVEEILGQTRTFIVAEGDLPLLESLRTHRPPGASASFEIRLRKKNGDNLDALLSVAPVVDLQGRPVPAPVLVTDISERKQVERQREELLAELKQKNKELETLVYVASHDLRSPLVNIQGFSQRLGKSLDELRRRLETAGTLEELRAGIGPLLLERMPGSLEFIRASGVKMDAIINGLLQLSRAGRMVLRPEIIDMNKLCQTVAASSAFQLQSVEGRLELDPLPPCRADPVQIAQVFSNLLDNAIKYRSGRRPLEVRISGRLQAHAAVYCVADNGIGIPPEHRERIWEIFQRLDPQGATAGEGLGLTLVRRMVERNGGRIWVEPGAEAGCRFLVELPLG